MNFAGEEKSQRRWCKFYFYMYHRVVQALSCMTTEVTSQMSLCMKGIYCDGSICYSQGRPTEDGDERRESDDDTSTI